MTNVQIAAAFDEIADLIEFQGANSFRVRAYRNASRTIADSTDSLAAMADEGGVAKLTELPGIGADLAKKCMELIGTGQLAQLTELRTQVPASVLQMLKVPGLGPKKAAVIYKELGVATLEDLKAVCLAGKVRELKGFGAKTEQTILLGIETAAHADKRLLWAEADEIGQALRRHFDGCPGVAQLELGGSYRRGKETVGDLDILVETSDVASAMDRLAKFPGVAEVINRGETKTSVRLGTGLQIDLRAVPAESFGAALQYFTGSKEHNVILRGMAKDRGLKINEYGVYRVGKDGKETYIAGKTEADVYATLELPVFPPESREARQEFEWAAEGKLPKLIEVGDLRGDLHMHTTATDGGNSLEEMIAAAQARGLEYIAITDHSKRVSMARGLDSDRVLAQWAEIDRLNAKLGEKFVVLKGIECDILEKGGMDLPDEVLAQADWVLASVHYGQQQPREQITARILGAIENPYVTAIAHPTGRLLGKREAYEVDLDAVLRAAKEHGKLLELNANPMRLDLNDFACIAARKLGIPIVINTDAHSTDQLGQMRYGILQARRAGLTAADVANTRTLAAFKKLIKKK